VVFKKNRETHDWMLKWPWNLVIINGDRAMKINTLIRLLALALGLSLMMPTNATLISRLGGQAYYDDVLDITWQTNANLADSMTFGVGGISASGPMSWYSASSWIAAMNTANYLGFGDWHLPTLRL
jgi:hypothetical protein